MELNLIQSCNHPGQNSVYFSIRSWITFFILCSLGSVFLSCGLSSVLILQVPDAEPFIQNLQNPVQNFTLSFNQSQQIRLGGISESGSFTVDYQYIQYYKRQIKSRLIQMLNRHCSGYPDKLKKEIFAELSIDYREPFLGMNSLYSITTALFIFPFLGYFPVTPRKGFFKGRITLRYNSGKRKVIDTYRNSFKSTVFFFSFYRNEYFEKKIKEYTEDLLNQGAASYCSI
ncbi:MAG: hypothetical protein OEZ34_01435 [Spirochaetia bacterium]|nr:hypothetical protein [Spirochaetia bacterium]